MPPNFTALAISIIKNFGYLGVGAIVFAESGFMLGFVLPGDSLLFAAGLLASQGYFNNIWILIAVIFASAFAGDNLSYFFGRHLGRKVFEKNSFIFNQDNLRKTEIFFERHGKITFLVQRFIPVVRAFASLLGGAGKMRYVIFFVFDFIGCVLWGAGITLAGFFLGSAAPGAERYLLPIVLAVIIISLIPTAIAYRKRK